MIIKPILTTLYIFATPADSHAYCLEHFDIDRIACAVEKPRACDLYVPAPQSGYDQDWETLTHEFEHCIRGDFH